MRSVMRAVTIAEAMARFPGVSCASTPLHTTQQVMDAISRSVGSGLPEKGGMLFGLSDRDGADVFEFDEQGSRTTNWMKTVERSHRSRLRFVPSSSGPTQSPDSSNP